MSPRGRAIYRLVARLLPSSFRAHADADLEAAAEACVARERARFGRAGVAWAWVRIVIDTIGSAVALRRQARARARLTSGGARPPGGFRMSGIGRDLARAWRALRRQPGFAAVAILTLALGLGANTAVFSVVYGVLWRPLPYPEPHRLLRVTSMFPQQFDSPFPLSVPEFVDIRDRMRAFDAIGAYYIGSVNLGAEVPERVVRGLVTHEVLPTLGVAPALGRAFTAADSQPGAADVAILSWGTWQRSFGGDPGVLGRIVRVSDTPTEVVGVLPEGFDIQDRRVALLQPLTIDPATFATSRAEHYLYLVGRLADGVTVQRAREDADRLQREGDARGGETSHDVHVLDSGHHPILLEPLAAELVADARTPLLLLQGAVLLVLLVACANLANLFLARADARVREYAVRTALGASRPQLFRQMLAEGVVLAAAGAIAGAALAEAGLRGLLATAPDVVPRAGEIALDRVVLGFTTAAAIATALVMAVVPFARLRTPSLARVIASAGTRASAGGARWRSLLVVSEVALAVLLVTGAGLLIRSVWNLTHVDVGFDRANLTTFSVVLPGATYDGPGRASFFERLRDRVGAIAGVEAVATMSGLPPLRSMNVTDTDFEHIPNDRPHGQPPIENVEYYQTVSLGYVETMGIEVARGRPFEPADAGGPPVALVNEALVRAFFPDRDPIGQRVKPPYGGFTLPWFTIVGVVRDGKQGGLGESSGTELYLLVDQMRRLESAVNMQHVVVRSARSAVSLAPDLRAAVGALDPNLPVVGLRSMDDVIAESVAEPRFLSRLLALFAAVALALAAIGTYGVLACLVAERRREFGIRLALGAERGRVLRLVVRRGLVLIGAGLVAGLAGSTLAARAVGTLLFGVSASDPVTLAAVAGVILLVGLTACLVPAWRATRVDPLTALRDA